MKYKYIIMTEFSDTYGINEITKEEIEQSNDGLIIIINVENGTIHIEDDVWEPLQEWNKLKENEND